MRARSEPVLCAQTRKGVEQSQRVQPSRAFEKGRWRALAHNDAAQHLSKKRLAYDFIGKTVFVVHGRTGFHEEPVPDPVVAEQQPEVG